MVPSLLGHPTHIVDLESKVSSDTSKQSAAIKPSGGTSTCESELEQAQEAQEASENGMHVIAINYPWLAGLLYCHDIEGKGECVEGGGGGGGVGGRHLKGHPGGHNLV